MTGAGKSHTMFGDVYDRQNEYDSATHVPGMVTLSANEFFNLKDENPDGFDIKLSYIEIYNE